MQKNKRRQNSIFAGQLTFNDNDLHLTDLDTELDRYNHARASLNVLVAGQDEDSVRPVNLQTADLDYRAVTAAKSAAIDSELADAMGLAGEKLEELLKEQAKNKVSGQEYTKSGKSEPSGEIAGKKQDADASLLGVKLDLTAVSAAGSRRTTTLKIANQFFQISSDDDIDYIRTIAGEADLMISTIQKQSPGQDKMCTLLLCLLNALDEKADLSFKLNEHDNLLQQSLLVNQDLRNKLAVSHREIMAYKRKVAKLAEIFSDILERFKKHKNDADIDGDNFKALILQIIEGDRNEKDLLSKKEQLSIFDII